MNISYVDPLRRAWDRMVRILFRPFRPVTWFTLGLAAFLAGLTSGGSGTGKGFKFFRRSEGASFGDLAEQVADFVRDPFWGTLLVGWGVVLIALAVVALWASSRGKFVFVENVVQERAAFVEPWRRFARLGNSLFWWWLAFAAVVVVLAIAASMPFWPLLRAIREGESFESAYLPVVFLTLCLEAPVVVLAMVIGSFSNAFVVPIMYRHDLTVMPAWGRLLGLIGRHPGSFLAFVFFTFLLLVAFAVVVMAVGFGTCCVGFMLMAIPYLGTIILLPFHVTMRGFTIEFLAQFGPEYNVLAPTRVDPAGVEPPPVNPAP